MEKRIKRRKCYVCYEESGKRSMEELHRVIYVQIKYITCQERYFVKTDQENVSRDMDTRKEQKIKGQIKGNKHKKSNKYKTKKIQSKKTIIGKSHTHEKIMLINPKKYNEINIYQSSRNGCSFRQRHKSHVRASSPLRYKMCRPITQGGCYYHYKKNT